MDKTYFLAVDKPGCAYQGHGINGEAINKDKVDILWHSWGLEGNALEHLGSHDRIDRPGFIWYKVPPKTAKDEPFRLLEAMAEEMRNNTPRPTPARTKDYIALRRARGHYSSFKPGETYNIWDDKSGRDYVIFAVNGKKRTSDLVSMVDVAYYAQEEGASLRPLLWSGTELVVCTKLVPTDQVITHRLPQTKSLHAYDVRKQFMPIEQALEEFSNDSTWHDDIYEETMGRYVKDSLALQQVLRRERKEKSGLFSSKKVQEVVPFYAVESLETASGSRTLCAVVRGPLQLSPGVLTTPVQLNS